jgi:hypothetical protein
MEQPRFEGNEMIGQYGNEHESRDEGTTNADIFLQAYRERYASLSEEEQKEEQRQAELMGQRLRASIAEAKDLNEVTGSDELGAESGEANVKEQ